MPDNFDDEVEFDDENLETLYLKYCFEGAATLAELSESLRALAAELDGRADAGWRLDGPVDGGFAHVIRDPHLAT